MKRSPRAKRAPQLVLPLVRMSKTQKGARRGPKPGVRGFVRHRARETSSPLHPLHVVMRSKYRSLRTQFVFPTLRKALADATRARDDFRITQFSVQGDHVHLVVEADSKQALSRGMQGLAIRIARRVNRLVSRSGKLWADRFFSRALSSPRSVRNALAYVLNNFKKHRASAANQIDPYSSAPYSMVSVSYAAKRLGIWPRVGACRSLRRECRCRRSMTCCRSSRRALG